MFGSADLGVYFEAENKSIGESGSFISISRLTAIYWCDRGAFLSDQGKYDEALLAFDEAIRIDPEYADAWNGKGRVLNILGRLDEARDANQQAFNIRQGTSTSAPAIPTVASAVTSPLGTRENPMPRKTWVDLGDGWSINLCCVVPDATRAVLNENMFNDPPKAGHQFFLAKLTACYNGAGSDRFDGDYRLRAVGASNVAYSTFENYCGVIPEKLPDPEVFTGGCIEGYVGWEIRSSDADSLVMYDAPFTFGGNNEHVYIKLLP